jgi:hypothetical protein
MGERRRLSESDVWEPHGAKFLKWEKGEFGTCWMLASVELYVIVRWNGRNGRGREGPRFY